MPIASVIVEAVNGAAGAVADSLGSISDVSVYGVKENQIVVVIEGDTIKAVDETVRGLVGIENVLGVYPVFAAAYEDK